MCVIVINFYSIQPSQLINLSSLHYKTSSTLHNLAINIYFLFKKIFSYGGSMYKNKKTTYKNTRKFQAITTPIKNAFHVQNRGIPCKTFLAHNFHPKTNFIHYLMAVTTTKFAKFLKIGNLNFI